MTKIDRFLTERGVLAPLPDRPLETYEKYWERTVRWLAMAARAPGMVQKFGASATRELLNMAIGIPAYLTDDRLVPQLGRQGTYGFMLMPGGCRWALEKDQGGQCAFCEFQEMVDYVAGDLPFSHDEFMALFQAGFATMQDVDMVNIFTAGSFLNPGEIPTATQSAMATAIAGANKPAILRIESRVQYIVEETVRPLIDILSPAGKTLDIAIGFETQDDELRNKVLRKGMGRNGFIHAVTLAKSLGARVSVYVILMPTSMTEEHAVRECIESIRFAFETGADEVLLQARYSHYDHVQCPKLWSIVKVLSETASLGPVMLGNWEGELPEPKVWPKNCPTCTPQVMKVLEQWRSGLNPSTLAEDKLPDCSCRKDWEADMAKDLGEPGAKKPHLPVIP